MAKQKKRKRSGLVLALLACFILIIAVIAGCIIYMNMDNDSGTQTRGQQSAAEDTGEQVKSIEEIQSNMETAGQNDSAQDPELDPKLDPKQGDAVVNEIADRWNQSSSFIRSSDCTEYSDDDRTDYYDKDGKAVRFVQEIDGNSFTYLFGDNEELIYVYERDGEGQAFHYFYQDGSLICYRSGMGRNYAPFDEVVQTAADQYYQNGESLLSDRLKDRKEEDKDKEEDGEDLIEGNPEDYIIQESNKRLLTEEDLEGLSSAQMRLARNEIFARHGRIFGSSDLQEYFESKPWYKGTADSDEFQDSVLSEIESKNVEFILAHE